VISPDVQRCRSKATDSEPEPFRDICVIGCGFYQ
jgi:hypothetical protein